MSPELVTAAGTLGAAAIVTVVLTGLIDDDVTTARREAGAFVAALLLFALFYLAFFFQDLLSGNYLAPGDSLDFGVADYLSAPALWTDGMWSGYPVAADPQSLTWYPVLRLFRTLGVDWNVFLVSAYVLTSTTTFLFVRRLTRSTLAGVFSGFVSGFCGMMLGYIGNFNQIHAFAWVPLALYGLQSIREGRYRSGTAVAALAVALMWLAGHPQIPVYATYLAMFVVAGGLLIDRPPSAVLVRRLSWSACALALGLLLAAIVLVPTLELGRFSPRSGSSWTLYSSSALPPRELFALLLPFSFGGFWTASGSVPYLGESGDSGYAGLLALALTLAAPLVLTRARREARLWLALALLEALLCLGPATPIGTLFYYAPGYGNFQAPLRHLFFVSLCMAVGSGVAVAELTARRDRRRLVAVATSMAACAAAIGIAVFAWRSAPMRELLASSPAYLRFAVGWPLVLAGGVILSALIASRLPEGRRGAVAFGVLLVALQVGDLTMLHYRVPGRRFRYADVRRNEGDLHPALQELTAELTRTGERILATDGSRNQFLLPNLTRAWGVRAASGTGSLPIDRYIEMLGMSSSGTVPAQTLSAPHHGIDLFGIRYALVRQNSELATALAGQGDRWQPIENLHYYEDDPDTHYTLFKNLHNLPRAWCAQQAVHIGPSDALAAIRGEPLRDGNALDFSHAALYEDDTFNDWPAVAGGSAADTQVERVGQNRYVVSSSAPCLLVIGEVYYPWWRAAVDRQSASVARVNYAMLGVAVPPGRHTVVLSITPLSVWLGGGLSGAGVLIWLALLVPARFRARPNLERRSVPVERSRA